MAAVEMLIESLNEDGYLADPLDEIAASLLDEDTDEDTREDVMSRLRCALSWLQNMDPIGVGAANLSDCLILQLRALPRSEAQVIAILICKSHLELLARRDIDDIHRAVDYLNTTTQWVQTKATDDQVDAVTDALLLAMHDLRSVLVRKKAERLMKGEAAE